MTPEEYRAEVASRMPEADLQAQVIKLAKVLGWRWYHTHDSRRSPGGFPDLVLVRSGRLLFVELKKQSGRVTATQQEWLLALDTAVSSSHHEDGMPVDVFVWRPLDLLDGTVESVLR